MKEKHGDTIFWQTFCYSGFKGRKKEGPIWAIRFSESVVGGWSGSSALKRVFECSIALENFTPQKTMAS